MKQVTPQVDEIVHWSERDVIIPAGLGMPGVPTEVAGLYVKKRLVGTECRSGLSRMQTRTGWGRDKFRKWDLVGWQMGWWFLLVEGSTSWDDKKKCNVGAPREWYLCPRPYELPPQELVDRVLNSRALPPQPPKWDSPLKVSTLKFSALKTRARTRSLKVQQDLKSNKRARKTSLSKASPQDLEALARINAVRVKSRYGRPLIVTDPDAQAAGQLQTLLGPELEDVYKNYLTDSSTRLVDNDHPLAWLMPSLNSYLPKPAKGQRTDGIFADPAPASEPGAPGLLDRMKDLIKPAKPEAA